MRKIKLVRVVLLMSLTFSLILLPASLAKADCTIVCDHLGFDIEWTVRGQVNCYGVLVESFAWYGDTYCNQYFVLDCGLGELVDSGGPYWN
jgi:hypothetical protein